MRLTSWAIHESEENKAHVRKKIGAIMQIRPAVSNMLRFRKDNKAFVIHNKTTKPVRVLWVVQTCSPTRHPDQ